MKVAKSEQWKILVLTNVDADIMGGFSMKLHVFTDRQSLSVAVQRWMYIFSCETVRLERCRVRKWEGEIVFGNVPTCKHEGI